MSETDSAEEMREKLLKIIEDEGMIRKEKLTPDATIESLGLASYDMVMILMGIEDRFGIYLSVDSDLAEVKTLSGLLDVLAQKIVEHRANPPEAQKPAIEPPAAGAQ